MCHPTALDVQVGELKAKLAVVNEMHEMRRGCVEVLQWWIRTVKIQNPNGRVVGNARVDGGPTQRLASGNGRWAFPRSRKGSLLVDKCRTGVPIL